MREFINMQRVLGVFVERAMRWENPGRSGQPATTAAADLREVLAPYVLCMGSIILGTTDSIIATIQSIYNKDNKALQQA